MLGYPDGFPLDKKKDEQTNGKLEHNKTNCYLADPPPAALLSRVNELAHFTQQIIKTCDKLSLIAIYEDVVIVFFVLLCGSHEVCDVTSTITLNKMHN